MENNYPLEVIPAAAISIAIEETPALIVDTSGNNTMAGFLKKLYAHSKYRLYYTRPGINQLSKTQSLSAELGIKTIILCGNDIPALANILPTTGFTAGIISPGTTLSQESITKTILQKPSLLEFSYIGYQSYRTNPLELQEISNRNYEDLRLGLLRNDPTLAEPLVRTKEYLFLDLRSVRLSDFPKNPLNSPNGLYAEEICQLARYIGMGQSLKSLFIYGIPSDLKSNPAAGELIAEIIWHVVEALSANVDEDPHITSKEDCFLRKIVSMGQDGQDLVFVTSKSTGRWWMEVPNIKLSKNICVPCSYSDYTMACTGDVPIRWLFFFQKLNPI